MWNPFKALGDKVEDKSASALADVFAMFIVKIGRVGIRAAARAMQEFDEDRTAEYQAVVDAIKH